MVEFALLVPIVLLLLFGTITTGLVFSDNNAVTNAVREGARYGAASDAGTATWAADVQTRVKQTYFGANGASLADSDICVQLVTSAGTVFTSDPGTGCGTRPTLPTMATGSCAVVVWMQRAETIQLAVAPALNFRIGAQSVAFYGTTMGTTCTAS